MKHKKVVSQFLFLISLVVLLFSFNIVTGRTETVDQLIEQGEKAVDAKNMDVAEKNFSDAVALEPQNAEAHFQLGTFWMNEAVVHQDKELLFKAMAENEAALRIQPLMGEAHDNLAYCYYILRDYKKSNTHYKKAVAQGVNNGFLKERLDFFLKGERKSKPPVTNKPLPKTEPKTEPKKIPPSSSDDELGGGFLQ